MLRQDLEESNGERMLTSPLCHSNHRRQAVLDTLYLVLTSQERAEKHHSGFPQTTEALAFNSYLPLITTALVLNTKNHFLGVRCKGSDNHPHHLITMRTGINFTKVSY